MTDKRLFFRYFLVISIIFCVLGLVHAGVDDATRLLQSLELRRGTASAGGSNSITLKTARVAPMSLSATVSQASVLMDLQTMEQLVLSDSDNDGFQMLDDMAPDNPFAHSLDDLNDIDGDGYRKWQDINDEDSKVHLTGKPEIDLRPKTLASTEKMLQYGSKEAIIEDFLSTNASAGLYPASEVLNKIAENNLVSEETLAAWRSRFSDLDGGTK